MDGIYDNLWDVTVLEYAVSMHTRRGDQSRKKLALEKVNDLRLFSACTLFIVNF